MLTETGIDNIAQALPLLPGVTGATLGISTNAWAIRGISSNDWTIGSEPSVAIYVDDAYVGRNLLATTAFFDVASVDALKGPQGTLFGRNASAGAITLRTNRPEFETSLNLGIGYGNEGQRQYDAVGNVALSDTVAVRAAYRGTRYEGLWTDVANQADMFRDEDAFRASILWDASDDLQAIFTVNYGEQATNNNSAYNPQLSTVAPGDPFPDRIALDLAELESNETTGANLRVEWALSDSLTFTSITDAREAEYGYAQDLDGANNGATIDAILGGVTGSVTLDFVQDSVGMKTFGQEFRLAFTSSQLNWFAGVNYYEEELEEDQNFILRNTLDLPEFGLPSGLELGRDRNDNRADNESYGAFADLQWALSDRLRLTGGVRYTNDNKDFCTQGQASLFLGTLPTIGQVCDSQDWQEVTPRVVVDYDLSDTMMTYASVSRGYKAGGYNPSSTDTNGDFVGDTVNAFDPEVNLSYELGFKSEFMDNRLRVNLAAFLSQYEDIQVQIPSLEGIIIDNASEADIAGGELEITFAASDKLTLSASYALADGEYKDAGVYDGNSLIFAPEDTFTASGTFVQPLAAGEVSFFALYTWQSEMFFTPINSDELSQDSYGLLSGRLAYTSGSERWSIALRGENLLDEEFANVRSDIGLGTGTQINRGLPRRYMVSVNLYF
jgi:iron complex outermembrane receptor protein